MATVVMVHGIAQQQRSADVLEAMWKPALAGGVRLAGDAELADRLTGRGSDSPEVRMAFYGDIFLAEDAQGDGAVGTTDDDVLATELDLARAMLTRALEVGTNQDKASASRALAATSPEQVDAMGAAATIRPAVEALARIGWVADLGLAFGQRYVWQELRQVSAYLTIDAIRQSIQERVRPLLSADTRLVIGHSLGSVVAYEAVRRLSAGAEVQLLTMGSPLGLRGAVTRRLEVQPPSFPDAAVSWLNLADLDDLVAGQPQLASIFPDPDGAKVVEDAMVDNGRAAHAAEAYLGKQAAGEFVIRALSVTPEDISGTP